METRTSGMLIANRPRPSGAPGTDLAGCPDRRPGYRRGRVSGGHRQDRRRPWSGRAPVGSVTVSSVLPVLAVLPSDDRVDRPVVPVHCPAARPDEGYRMGRWSRLAMTLIVVAAAIVVTVRLVSTPDDAGFAPVVVQTGDTLWSIAERYAGDRDPSDVVDAIVSMNRVADGPLPQGLVLAVPVG